MSNPDQQRQAQLQAQMTVSLNELRAKTATQMIEALDRIEQRPRIKGDGALPTLAGDSRLNRDTSGGMLIGAAMGIPGLSGMTEAAIDIGAELFGSRKATRARPQDNNVLSIKEMATIRDKNKQDIQLFASLGEKLNLLDTYISSGYSKGSFMGGALLPIENGPEQEYKPSENNQKLAHNQNKIAMPMPKVA
ncbi:MAG: hypothetical protein COB76_02745 [Alphaproteobacteria bacterium]|nr:MAG: hypothetical protein COB76_02745 [Alphaproteobacteria bacterium]